MTELYNSRYNLQDVAREGLIQMCSEGVRLGNQTLINISLQKLKELDRIKTQEQLGELRNEINNLIKGGPEEATNDSYRDLNLGS